MIGLAWWAYPIAVLLPATVVAVLAWPWSKRLTVWGLIDEPGEDRRLHQKPTPRGGGIAILAGLLGGLLWLAILDGPLGLHLGVFAFWSSCALIGFLEDVQPRPVVIRLLAQWALALVVVISLGPITVVNVGAEALSHPWLWAVLACIALVWLMNIHNFMDGADGLATCQGIWTSACYGVIFALAGQPDWALVSFLFAGACIGFLGWNFPSARLFMGDSGSLLLGGWVGLMAYHAVLSQAASLLVCLMISAVFVVDATATLVWRVLKGEQWYTAHASHAFQRLIAGGLSHRSVVMFYMLCNLLVVLPMIVWAQVSRGAEWWLCLALLAGLSVGWWQIQKVHVDLKAKG